MRLPEDEHRLRENKREYDVLPDKPESSIDATESSKMATKRATSKRYIRSCIAYRAGNVFYDAAHIFMTLLTPQAVVRT
jgi:hypothetical protein